MIIIANVIEGLLYAEYYLRRGGRAEQAADAAPSLTEVLI